MNRYEFYVEGLDVIIEVEATSEYYAEKAMWDSLSDEDQYCVISIECVKVLDLGVK